MRYDKFREDNPDVWAYIKENYLSLKDFELSNKILELFHIQIDPEKIRNIRRAEDWKKKEVKNNGSNLERVLFIGDFHIPDHDEKLVNLLLKFIKFFKPHKCYILGDLIDCYPVSKFCKSIDRMGKLQAELDIAIPIIDQIQKYVEDITFLEGNHEERIATYLQENPALFGLKCLEIKSLLGLKDRNIKFFPYKHEPIEYHKFQIHHGSLIRKHSGWTAKALYDRYGGCGICGHSHRGSNYIKRTRQGIFGWYENMCLCKLSASYGDFFDWHQGWSIAYFTKKDLFHLEQIPVIDHEFLFQGRLFSI